MIRNFRIDNYKSVNSLEVTFGRVNVIIGENGSGKSNLLEAIALFSAAASDKLDREFLSSRGIRDVEPQLMRACFNEENKSKPIELTAELHHSEYRYELQFLISNENKPYSKWTKKGKIKFLNEDDPSFYNPILDKIENFANTTLSLEDRLSKLSLLLKEIDTEKDDELKKIKFELNDISEVLSSLKESKNKLSFEATEKIFGIISKFIIYSPENTALRNFYKEGQIEPLGINGEGLIKLLKVTRDNDKNAFETIKNYLKVFCWYDDINIPSNSNEDEYSLLLTDRYLSNIIMDQRSANEGFLFILFYVSLIVSKETPQYIAIDNIDASLNPKLCTKLMRDLVELSKKHNKQLFLTTHNPAILDGLDISDNDQKLFVASRSKQGYTKLKCLSQDVKPVMKDGTSMKLSDALMRGYLGGLPKGF